MNRPDFTYVGWWRWKLVVTLAGEDLPTKLNHEEFGGGRRGGFLRYDEIQQYMCSVQGCGRRAQASWSGCADENINRPLCPEHDVQINVMALVWWGDPQAPEKIKQYVESMEHDIDRPVEPWAYDTGTLYAQIAARLDEIR